MSEKTIKLEIELDQDKKLEIDIISKAFGWTPERFIQYVIKNDIKYIKDNLERGSIIDLQENYNTGVDLGELKKFNNLRDN